MDEANIRKYAKLMRELELTGLEITEGNTVVRLERGVPPAAVSAPVVPLPETKAESAGGDVVRSPMVGVFYAAPDDTGFKSIVTSISETYSFRLVTTACKAQ